MMASFFGEVLPTVSRAVDDDEDDADGSTDYDNSEITWMWESKVACKVLIVAVGPIACGFTRSFVLPPLSGDCVGTLVRQHSSRGDETIRSTTTTLCEVHKCNENVLACLNLNPMPPEDTFEATRELMSAVSSSRLQVVVLCGQHVTDYQTDEVSMDAPFLRCLKTSVFSHETPCGLLEQPNTVSGFAAAVMTRCQVENIPAVLYTSYSDVMDVDSVTMSVFANVARYKPLREMIVVSPRAPSNMASLNTFARETGNLYM